MYIPLMARVESLPPLPQSVLELEKLFTSEYPEINELVDVISRDPSLTADILSKVNAPFYGFTQQINSLTQALTLFGSSQIRAMILASSIQKCFEVDLSPYGITTTEFSKISSMQSELIFQWYMEIDITLAREITPIAFLMEIGKILIAKDILGKEKQEDFLKDLHTYTDISDVENIYTMMSTPEVNALIFKQLNLNKTFTETMRYFNDEESAPKSMKETLFALQTVQKIINIREQFNEETINEVMHTLKEKSYDVNSLQRVIRRIQNKYMRAD